ncbi:hypothetical protein WN943_011685 [Citrus x changshan-huyou]
MSLLGKVETVVEAKVPAAKFHKLFSCKPHVVASMSPQSVRLTKNIDANLLKGERN